MNTLKSKFSLLTALLCLALMTQGQVTNPYNSSFEIDLTGTADPQLVLKREVTTPSGGTLQDPTEPITRTYHWIMSAGQDGVSLSSVNPIGNILDASILSTRGLTILGDELSVGNHFNVNNIETVIENELKVIGRSITVNDGTDNQFRVYPNGRIRARRINVDLDPIADYVFEPDYNLMSIEELDAYIKEHKHLPGIKSADEYEQIGSIDLGELELQLLEKVEELTLYTIELKEELKATRAQLEELKEKVDKQ